MVNVARDEYGKVLEGYLRSRLRLAPVSALLALYVPYSLPSPINTHNLICGLVKAPTGCFPDRNKQITNEMATDIVILFSPWDDRRADVVVVLVSSL